MADRRLGGSDSTPGAIHHRPSGCLPRLPQRSPRSRVAIHVAGAHLVTNASDDTGARVPLDWRGPLLAF